MADGILSSLGERELIFLTIVAVGDGRFSHNQITNAARDCGHRDEKGRHLTRYWKDIKNNCIEAGSLIQTDSGLIVAHNLIGPLRRLAVDRGEYAQIVEFGAQHQDSYRRQKGNPYDVVDWRTSFDELSQGVTHLRHGIFRGKSAKFIREILDRLLSFHMNEMTSGAFWGEVFWGIEDWSWISSMIQGYAFLNSSDVACGILRHQFEYADESFKDTLEIRQAAAAYPCNSSLVLADIALLENDQQSLKDMAKGLRGDLLAAYAEGLLMGVCGRHEQLCNEHYAKFLRMWRKATKAGQKAHPNGLLATLITAANFAADPEATGSHFKNTWLQQWSHRSATSLHYSLSQLIHLFGSIVDGNAKGPPNLHHDIEYYFTFTRIAFALLLNRFGSKGRKLACTDKKLLAYAKQQNLTWLHLELNHLHAQPEKTATEQAAQAITDLGFVPITSPAVRIPKWQKQLRLLTEITQPLATTEEKAGDSAAQTEGRLAWMIELPTNRGGDWYHDARVSALEQKSRASGWTRGRPIAMERLKEGEGKLPPMTALDKQLIGCMETRINSWNYNVEWTLDLARALPLLEQHPLVLDEDRQALVLRQRPILFSMDGDKKIELTLSPPAKILAQNEDGVLLWQKSASEVDYLIVDKVVSDFAANLAKNPGPFPAEAAEGLQHIARRLATRISVSGLESVDGSRGETADAMPLCRLRASGGEDDAGSLRLELGHLFEGVLYRSGRGPERFLQRRDGEDVTLRRDFLAEEGKRRELLNACPLLAESLDAEDRGSLQGMAQVLPLLEQLQAASEQQLVVVEADDSAIPRLRQPQSQPRGSLQTNSGGWLEFGAEVQVDEGLVLDAADLLSKKTTRRGRFVQLKDGAWLSLGTKLAAVLDDLKSVVQAPSAGDSIVRVDQWAALGLLSESDAIQYDDKWAKRLKGIKSAPVAPAPTELQAQLRPYQLEGYQWMQQMLELGAGVCLADDMGLGKTVQSLALLCARAHQGPALVIAPTSVCGVWRSEAARFAPFLRVIHYAGSGRDALLQDLKAWDVVVASYGVLQRDGDALTVPEWATAILDEAHAIKNSQTIRAKTVRKIKAQGRLALTGTPVENRLQDLHSLFAFLQPQLLGSAKHFQKQFADPIEMGQDKVTRDRLHRLLRPFLLRRDKSSVLQELPARTELTYEVQMNDDERAFYETLRREAAESISAEQEEKGSDGVNRIGMLAHLTRLRRACCHPALVKKGWSDELAAKQRAFFELFEELRAGGHRVLVFSQFVDHLALVENELKQRGITYQYLDGSTPAKERTRRVAAFQRGEGDCFLISLKAGGTGLTLTAADFVIHLDPWWNPAVEDQASDRAHRIGQQRPVTIYRLVVPDSVEEGILALHERKRNLSADILSGNDSALNGDDLIRLLTEL